MMECQLTWKLIGILLKKVQRSNSNMEKCPAFKGEYLSLQSSNKVTIEHL